MVLFRVFTLVVFSSGLATALAEYLLPGATVICKTGTDCVTAGWNDIKRVDGHTVCCPDVEEQVFFLRLGSDGITCGCKKALSYDTPCKRDADCVKSGWSHLAKMGGHRVCCPGVLGQEFILQEQGNGKKTCGCKEPPSTAVSCKTGIDCLSSDWTYTGKVKGQTVCCPDVAGQDFVIEKDEDGGSWCGCKKGPSTAADCKMDDKCSAPGWTYRSEIGRLLFCCPDIEGQRVVFHFDQNGDMLCGCKKQHTPAIACKFGNACKAAGWTHTQFAYNRVLCCPKVDGQKFVIRENENGDTTCGCLKRAPKPEQITLSNNGSAEEPGFSKAPKESAEDEPEYEHEHEL